MSHKSPGEGLASPSWECEGLVPHLVKLGVSPEPHEVLAALANGFDLPVWQDPQLANGFYQRPGKYYASHINR